ncbi:HIT family protein [Nonomuraea sp. NPDC048892]|uniref:HIT family protein n=1 Tax=Nonomuraea sp. NPDC048892 TaxID=3154624 RepID=UPI0033D6CC78
MAGTCTFCGIIAGDIPAEIVHSDEHVVAFLDISQATRGHTLVVPREHCRDLTDIGPDRAGLLMRGAVHTADLLRRALEPGGMNIWHATGATAWQSVFHFHLHLLPRYATDDLRQAWTHRELPLSSLAPLADQIRTAAEQRPAQS